MNRSIIVLASLLLFTLLAPVASAEVWNADLRLGTTHPEVRSLQQFLNLDTRTKLAESGVGSPGQETEYFGQKTDNAVKRFQFLYKPEILTPLGLAQGTGYVGALTRKVLNAVAAVIGFVPATPSVIVDANAGLNSNSAYNYEYSGYQYQGASLPYNPTPSTDGLTTMYVTNNVTNIYGASSTATTSATTTYDPYAYSYPAASNYVPTQQTPTSTSAAQAAEKPAPKPAPATPTGSAGGGGSTGGAPSGGAPAAGAAAEKEDADRKQDPIDNLLKQLICQVLFGNSSNSQFGNNLYGNQMSSFGQLGNQGFSTNNQSGNLGNFCGNQGIGNQGLLGNNQLYNPLNPNGQYGQYNGSLGQCFNPHLTSYSPQHPSSPRYQMEGGYESSQPGLDRSSYVKTLEDVRTGKSNYVTLAGDNRSGSSQIGKTYIIPSITYIGDDRQSHTLTNVRAYVHDTGSAFNNNGGTGSAYNRTGDAGLDFDIAVTRDGDDQLSNQINTRDVQFCQPGSENQVAANSCVDTIPQHTINGLSPTNSTRIGQLANLIPQHCNCLKPGSVTNQNGNNLRFEANVSQSSCNPQLVDKQANDVIRWFKLQVQKIGAKKILFTAFTQGGGSFGSQWNNPVQGDWKDDNIGVASMPGLDLIFE